MSSTTIQRVNYHNKIHAAALMRLLNRYAEDPMGGASPLGDEANQYLIDRLKKFSGAISLLAYQADQAVGLLNAFIGFSTFKAKPLINIHDLTVIASHRGQGIAQQLLHECEVIAKEKGCCKMTLEVLEANDIAKKSYRQFGFYSYTLDEQYGSAEFWEKPL